MKFFDTKWVFISLISLSIGFSQVAPAYFPYNIDKNEFNLESNIIQIVNNEVDVDFFELAELNIRPDQFIWSLTLIFPEITRGYLKINNWDIPADGKLFIFNNSNSYTGPYLKSSQIEFLTGRFIAKELLIEYSEPVISEYESSFNITGIRKDFNIESAIKENHVAPILNKNRERPKILLTGYWPPTNEMVRHFSQNSALNPDGWQGENWEELGYDVVSYFPEFTPADCNDCGQGYGDLEVDYQDFSQDFWPIVDDINPIAIMTFSRGYNDMSWELENRVVNRTNWYDDYTSPYLPTPNPPDDSVDIYHVRYSSLPVEGIITEIIRAEIGLDPYLDDTNAGMFLSEFAGYHGVWHKENNDESEEIPCIAGGHIHVGKQIDWETARQATEISLRVLIDYINQFMVLPGDCNSDGEINILDLVALANVILEFSEFTPVQGIAADLDENGLLNILDIIAIVNLILSID